MNFRRYHVSKNLCPIANFYKTTGLYYSILFETPLPAGTYTISAEITSTSTESRISFRKNDMSQIIAFNITIQTGRSQLTFTISEPCYALYIYGSTSVFDNIPIKFENIMLNTGSTPLPYEPYSSEVWHDIPYYQHKTATDILTLPAVIYPNDTSITVGIKGNEEHTGTPTPQNPVVISGTGDLETSGEHTGQYKIPISMGGTTNNVYLGEVQTERKIYKFVLTGQEDWKNLSSDNTKFYLGTISPDYLRADSQITYMCTHYIPYEQTISATLVPNMNMSMSSGAAQRLYIADANFTTVDQLKTYLQQQYAAGTPVTIWYVLATEETGIVNEPLRKIGTYADSVSGITIPTITGKDTFDVLTTLKPSEVSLAYTGWHDATVEEWDGSEWQ